MGVLDEVQQSDSGTSGVNMGDVLSLGCVDLSVPQPHSDQVLWFAVLGRNYCAF